MMDAAPTKLTDAHLREIAALRQQIGYRYAPVLAAKYGKPVTTIHRWIREAAKRGFLSAGHPEHRCRCRCGRRFDQQGS